MSEGQLYKKLREMAEEESGTTDRGYIQNTWLSILDEAKKDFEELLDVRLFNEKYGNAQNQAELYCLAQLYQVCTIEKLKKWFGEPSVANRSTEDKGIT